MKNLGKLKLKQLKKEELEREREVAERQGEMDKLAAGIVVVER